MYITHHRKNPQTGEWIEVYEDFVDADPGSVLLEGRWQEAMAVTHKELRSGGQAYATLISADLTEEVKRYPHGYRPS